MYSIFARNKYAKEFSDTEQFKIIEKREGKSIVRVRHLTETHFEKTDDGSQGEQYQEQILLCSSEQRGKKEKAIVSNAEERFLADLVKFQKRVKNQKKLVSQQIIDSKIRKLQQNHPRVQRYYKIWGKSETRDFSWTRIDKKYLPEKALTGCYILVGLIIWY